MGDSLRIARVSVEDYLAGERLAEVRHEYVDGELFAMTGASRTHNRLTMNLSVRLGFISKVDPAAWRPPT